MASQQDVEDLAEDIGLAIKALISDNGTDIVTNWESTLSDAKVPSEKLTKNTIDGKADSVHTHTKSQITDFPTLSTVATSGSYNDLSNQPSIPSSSSDLSDSSDIIKKSNTSGLIKNDGTIDTTNYISDVSGKADKTGWTASKNIVTNSSGALTTEDKPTLSSLGGTVTVEKQTTAESGYAATYIVKQNNTQVGNKINIPKDFLVKSAELKTSTANNSPETGYISGDKYVDFTINTIDGSETASHIYLNVKDLVDAYTADETTLTLSNNNQFSIKSVPSHTHNYLTSSDISGKIDTAGTGLSKSGTTLNHSNSINARTTAALKKYKYDAQGHITEESDISASDLPTASTSQAGTVQLVNDLTTGGTTKALTAEQGKALNDLIGQAITYINS